MGCRKPAWQPAPRCWTKAWVSALWEREPVANDEHLGLLWQGAAVRNEWRVRNPGVMPDLRQAHLSGTNPMGADLLSAKIGNVDRR